MRSSNKKLIIFDFDYTLFDAEKWRRLTYTHLAKLFQEDEKKFLQIAKDVYDTTRKIGYFDPQFFAKELAIRFENRVSLEKIVATVYNANGFESCFYPETVSVLKTLSEIAELSIFSTNEQSFFQAKFAFVKEYFKQNKVLVHADKQQIVDQISAFTKDYSVYIVDDLLLLLQIEKQINQEMHTVWIKRGPYAEKNSGSHEFQPDSTILTLHELLPIIMK